MMMLAGASLQFLAIWVSRRDSPPYPRPTLLPAFSPSQTDILLVPVSILSVITQRRLFELR
jgi:hypothetical protein